MIRDWKNIRIIISTVLFVILYSNKVFADQPDELFVQPEIALQNNGEDPNEYTYGEYKYVINDNDTVTITGLADEYKDSFIWDPVIPSSICEKDVISIEDEAFSRCDSLVGNLTISPGIERIGDRAFYCCEGFGDGKLTLPNSLSVIGEGAFEHCAFTDSLVLPEDLTEIGIEAFNGCRFTGGLQIPDEVTEIPDYAFSGGFDGELILPDGLTRIGEYAFSGCGFTGELEIPDSVDTIDDYAFCCCPGFTGDLVIPEGVTTIGGGAFSENNCGGYSGMLVIPSTVTSVGDAAFQSQYGITVIKNNSNEDIVLSDFFGTIAYSDECYTSESGERFDKDDSIGKGLFTRSGVIYPRYVQIENFLVNEEFWLKTGAETALRVDFFPQNSTKKKMKWISSDTKVATVTSDGVVKGISEGSAFISAYGTSEDSNRGYICMEVHVTSGTIYATDINNDGGQFNRYVEVGNSITLAPTILPRNADDKEVIWESSDPDVATVTSRGVVKGISAGNVYIYGNISHGTRRKVTYYVTVKGRSTINNDGTYIYRTNKDNTVTITGLVEGVTLKDAVIPSSINEMPVKAIGTEAFDNCSNLEGSLTIPDSVTTIGVAAFSGCKNLNGNLTIGKQVNKIEDYAFLGCGFTGYLYIPSSVTEIGGFAFYECGGFTGNLIIPDNVKKIGMCAFASCSGFNGNLTIGRGITEVANGTFQECSGLIGNLIIPNSVKTIGTYAFYNCRGFNGNLLLGKGIKNINSCAFYNCSGFTGDLTIPEGAEEVDIYGIGGLDGCLTIPKSVRSLFCSCQRIGKIINNSSISFGVDNTFIEQNSDGYFICNDGRIIKSGGFIGKGIYTRSGKPKTVSVKGITLEKVKESISVGGILTLNATISPSDATNKKMTWKSSNTGIATVDANGKVKGISAGTVTVTVTTDDGKKTASCIITVKASTTPAPQKISLKGAKIKLSKYTYTYNGKDRNPSIKKVTIGGKVLKEGTDYLVKRPKTSKKVGQYTIKLTGKGNYNGTTTATYNIKKARNTLKVSGKSVNVGASTVMEKSKTISAKKLFKVKKKNGKVTYKKIKGNKKIIVAQKGSVTIKPGIKKGPHKVRVKVTAEGDKNHKKGSKTVTITVNIK